MTQHKQKRTPHIIIVRSQFFYGGFILPWGGVSEIVVTQHIKNMTPHIFHMTQAQFIMTPHIRDMNQHEISTTPCIFSWLRHNRNFWLRRKRVTFCDWVIKTAWIIFFCAGVMFFLWLRHITKWLRPNFSTVLRTSWYKIWEVSDALIRLHCAFPLAVVLESGRVNSYRRTRLDWSRIW